MASIIGKTNKKSGVVYYYYVESKRVGGKPKPVNQVYLGNAEKLRKMALEQGKSLQDQVLYAREVDFGAVALLYHLAMRMEIPSLIDSLIPKRNQGASVGMYILIAAINRAVAPTSKSGLKEWYEKTCLPYITGLPCNLFTPQNFWNNTDISVEQLSSCEDAILRKAVGMFEIDFDHLIYDATNFFTYIDTQTPSEYARRTMADKARRSDLRTVGLALTVTPDFSIPMVSATYPGSRNDSAQFTEMIRSLKDRFEKISDKKADITIVFDRGNNSEANLDLLESGGMPFHYVAGLKKNQTPELFDIPKKDYAPLECPGDAADNYKALTCISRDVEVFGRTVHGTIYHNPELEKGQVRGIRANMEKTASELSEKQGTLLRRARGEIRKGKKPTAESVTRFVEKTLATREYMEDIFEYEILEKNGNIYLTYAASEKKLDELREAELGKTALFTDRGDLTPYQLVHAYRSAWHVESSFRQMKDTDFLTVRPIFHWTDPKIAVHIFTCVLAYRLCCLLRKELSGKGITGSIDEILKSMSDIRRITTFYGDMPKPKKLEAFTQGNELATKIEETYHLQKTYYG